jgi:hypothetical protein
MQLLWSWLLSALAKLGSGRYGASRGGLSFAEIDLLATGGFGPELAS